MTEIPVLKVGDVLLVSIQTELHNNSPEIPEDQQVRIRIGVNLGEVLEDRGEQLRKSYTTFGVRCPSDDELRKVAKNGRLVPPVQQTVNA